MSPWDSSFLDGELQYLLVFDISWKRQNPPFMSIWSAADPMVSASTQRPACVSQAVFNPDSMPMSY